MLHLDNEKFLKELKTQKDLEIKELNVSRSTVYFKLNLLKVLKQYPKLEKSSLFLNFFKNYFKTIKETCKENR